MINLPIAVTDDPDGAREWIATHFGGNYGLALAAVAGSVAIVIAVLTAAGTEAKGIVFAKAKAVAA